MNPEKILKKAQKEKRAVGQFNSSTFEITKAIVQAAKAENTAVIIGTSEGERGFWGEKNIASLVQNLREETEIPIFLNADHCKSLKSFKKAIDAGYNAAHIDGSDLEFEKNISLTRQCVQYAESKKRNILVEGELGKISGSSTVHKKNLKDQKQNLTNPEKVSKFTTKTGIDTLAISIGSAHGVYTKEPKLDFERLEIIRNKTKLPLVLHGGSGISDKDIRKAIKLGITKINVNTEIRSTYRKTLQKKLEENPQVVTPYKIMPPVIEAIQGVVEKKIKLFNLEF